MSTADSTHSNTYQTAVVIGSGLGGLAAAVRLRAMGYRVVVLEALSEAGGRARGFHHDNCYFDSGPTIVTAPYLFDELFALLGKCRKDYFDFISIDPFYQVRFTDGSMFTFYQQQELLLEQIKQINPADVDGYLRLCRVAAECCRIGYQQLGDKPFNRLTDMLGLAPAMLHLKAYRSIYSLVSRYIQDERLRQLLCIGPLFIGGNPHSTSAIYLLIHWIERQWGVHYPRGGIKHAVLGLIRLLEEHGVIIEYKTPVAEIIVNNGRTTGVRTENGEIINCSIVVSNGDPSVIYQNLINPKHRRKHSNWRIALKKQGPSVFVTYFTKPQVEAEIGQHTIFMASDFHQEINNIYRHFRLTDKPSLYLHLPGKTDPSLAPSGNQTGYLLSLVPNTKSGIDWSAHSERYLDNLKAALAQHGLNSFFDDIDIYHTIDPREFSGPLRSAKGAAFNLEPALSQTAYFRYHSVSEDVAGLYFVGAGAHPGAGIPGVLSSAKILDRVVPKPEQQLAIKPSAIIAEAT